MRNKISNINLNNVFKAFIVMCMLCSCKLMHDLDRLNDCFDLDEIELNECRQMLNEISSEIEDMKELNWSLGNDGIVDIID
jgi:hypothetical protein